MIGLRLSSRAAEYFRNSDNSATELVKIPVLSIRWMKKVVQSRRPAGARAAILRTSISACCKEGPFIAKWIDPASLASAVQAARKLGRTEHRYVSLDDDFLFWAFLHSVKVEGSPPGLVIDLRKLRKRA